MNEPLRTHSLTNIVQYAIQVMDVGGSVRIENDILARNIQFPCQSGTICTPSWTPPYPKTVPFYIYLKSHRFPIWTEYDSVSRSKCKQSQQLSTMNQASLVSARIASRIREAPARSIQILDANDTPLLSLSVTVIDTTF